MGNGRFSVWVFSGVFTFVLGGFMTNIRHIGRGFKGTFQVIA